MDALDSLNLSLTKNYYYRKDTIDFLKTQIKVKLYTYSKPGWLKEEIKRVEEEVKN